MKYKSSILLLSIFFLVACNKQQEEVQVETPELPPVEVVEISEPESEGEAIVIESSDNQDTTDVPPASPVPIPYPVVTADTEKKEEKNQKPEEQVIPAVEEVVEEVTIKTDQPDEQEVNEVVVEQVPVVEEVVEEVVEVGFTAQQVAEHGSESSCYTIINGAVYDVTSYLPLHPGGARNILKICGRDGTSTFTGKHGGDKKPEDQLKQFYIGPLIK